MDLILSYYDQTIVTPAGSPATSFPRLGFRDYMTLALTVRGPGKTVLDMSAATAWHGAVSAITETGRVVIARMLGTDIDFSEAAAGKLTVIVDCTSSEWAQQTAAGDVTAIVELCGVDTSGRQIFRARFGATAQAVADPVGGEKPLPSDVVTMTDVQAMMRAKAEVQFSTDGGTTIVTDPEAVSWVRWRNSAAGGEYSDWVHLLQGQPGAAATIEIFRTDTLLPDSPASVSEAPDSTEQNRLLIFGIPKGRQGDKGDAGASVDYSPFLRVGGVSDPVWGWCGSLGVLIDRMIIHTWQAAATSIDLYIVSSDATSVGDIVIIPMVNGVDQPEQIIHVTGAVTKQTVTLPGVGAVVGIWRPMTSQNDNLPVAAAVLGWDVHHG